MAETPKINNIGFGDTYPADMGGVFNVSITSLKNKQTNCGLKKTFT